MLTAHHAGVPLNPITPAYTKLSHKFERLHTTVAATDPIVIYAADAVIIAGHDRAEAALLIFSNLRGCRGLAPDMADAYIADIAIYPEVRARVLAMLRELAKEHEGAARVRRTIVLTEGLFNGARNNRERLLH